MTVSYQVGGKQSLKPISSKLGRPEGGKGVGTCPPGPRCLSNLGLLWQVDCLLFVLSRSSSIFVNYIQLYHYC